MATYLAILLVFYYFFAIIGMEIFGGLVKSNSNGSETWGTLWASPVFELKDLVSYFKKFGCPVKPYKYTLHAVPIIEGNNSPLPDVNGCRNSP